MAASMPPLPVAEMTNVHSFSVPKTWRSKRWLSWLTSKK